MVSMRSLTKAPFSGPCTQRPVDLGQTILRTLFTENRDDAMMVAGMAVTPAIQCTAWS